MRYLNIFLNNLRQKERINKLDIAIFFRQLATLITAGISLLKACDLLEKSQKKTKLKFLIYTIKQDISAGKLFSYSLRRHAEFDPLCCQLIQIGEHTGKMDKTLDSIAEHLEKNIELQRKIKQALFYPSIIISIAIIMTLGLLIFIIPKFAELFQEIQNELPIVTIWIFRFAFLLRQLFWPCVSISIMATLILYYQAHKFRPIALQYILRLPIMRHYRHKLTLMRFSRNLAITFAAGIPIMDALTLTANACGNTEFISITSHLRNKVGAGQQLNRAMQDTPYFPAFMTQMIKMGEESGKLTLMLNKTASLLEAEIDLLLNRLNQLLEPLIMLVLGALIGGLVIGMYLPIFKLGSTL